MFTNIFFITLILMVATKFWLAMRQVRSVSEHRRFVPDQFVGRLSLEDHQKAADYTTTNMRFAVFHTIFEVLVLLGFTMSGGIDWINQLFVNWFSHGVLTQIAVLLTVTTLMSWLEMPWTLYKQFVIEQRFGFNRMTFKLFVTDTLKSTVLGLLLGVPILWVVITLMVKAGALWWLYASLTLFAFMVLMSYVAPVLIAPLFNKFTPLEEGALKNKIEALLTRCGFSSSGVMVMDGSKRSSHANAYFTGFGRNKRIVFFDTLLKNTTPEEVEAVLAHELGHLKRKHLLKAKILMFVTMLGSLALLAWLSQQSWFYTGLGVTPNPAKGNLLESNAGLALLLFMLVMPIFTFFTQPLMSMLSRKHEYEADEFAAQQADAKALISALVKLYEDNAATVTPDELYSAFYHSHPPASLRISHLEGLIKV